MSGNNNNQMEVIGSEFENEGGLEPHMVSQKISITKIYRKRRRGEKG